MTRKAQQDLTDDAFEMIAARFRALSEPTRLKILHVLGRGEMSVGEIVEQTHTGQANVSKHLGLLLDAGIVSRRKVGLQAIYKVTDDGIFELCDTVCSSLGERLAAQQRAVKGFRRA